jgi:hypothetical protein
MGMHEVFESRKGYESPVSPNLLKGGQGYEV